MMPFHLLDGNFFKALCTSKTHLVSKALQYKAIRFYKELN